MKKLLLFLSLVFVCFQVNAQTLSGAEVFKVVDGDSLWSPTLNQVKTFIGGSYVLRTGDTMTGGIVNSTSVNPFTTLAESWIGPSSTTGIYFKGGLVGIATTAPSARLHSLSTTEQFRLGYDVNNAVKFTVGSVNSLTVTPIVNSTTAFNFTNAAGTSIFDVDATNGNVGIGTTGPGSILHAYKSTGDDITIEGAGTGTSGFAGLLMKTNSGNSAEIFAGGSGYTAFGGANSLNIVQYQNAPIQFSYGSTPLVTIKTSGNVGIGTVTPLKTFSISDNTDQFPMSVASDKLTFWNDAATPAVIITTDSVGTITAPAYGAGNKEDTDLSKTESAYASVYATDGTLLDKLISEFITGGGTVYYSTNNFTTVIPAAPAPDSNDVGIDTRRGSVWKYNGSSWATSILTDNGLLATTVTSDDTSPFTFDAAIYNRTLFSPSASKIDSVGSATNLASQNPNETFMICFENLTGSSDTIVYWSTNYINADKSAITKQVVLTDGDYKCFTFHALAVDGGVKMVYSGNVADLSSSVVTEDAHAFMFISYSDKDTITWTGGSTVSDSLTASKLVFGDTLNFHLDGSSFVYTGSDTALFQVNISSSFSWSEISGAMAGSLYIDGGSGLARASSTDIWSNTLTVTDVESISSDAQVLVAPGDRLVWLFDPQTHAGNDSIVVYTFQMTLHKIAN